MLTEAQARLVAEGMFRDSTAAGSRVITDKNGSKAVIVRVKAFTNRGKLSKRVLFFGEAVPVEVTTPQKDRIVVMVSNGYTLEAAIGLALRPEPKKPFGACDGPIDALLWARR
jgi:hypothetical protein